MTLKTILKVYLFKIYIDHPRNISSLIRAKYNKVLFDALMNNARELYQSNKRKYHLKTYIYWFLNDVSSFSGERCRCDQCNLPLDHRDVTTALLGYYRYEGSDHKYCDKCRMFRSYKLKRKRIETWKKKYNANHPMQNHDVVKRMEDRLELKNGKGIRNVFQIERVKLKMKETNLKKFGVEYSRASKERILKTKETNLKKIGYTSNLASPEFRKKSEQKWLKLYGIKRLPMWRYNYDNRSFDSSPELAYYIWLQDHKVDFIYLPNLDIKLYDESGLYTGRYFPDFLLCKTNTLVEIKGDQFFDEVGNPINPYNNKSWKEKYDWIKRHNVTLILEKDYKRYVQYCKLKYNSSNWKDQFKGKPH